MTGSKDSVAALGRLDHSTSLTTSPPGFSIASRTAVAVAAAAPVAATALAVTIGENVALASTSVGDVIEISGLVTSADDFFSDLLTPDPET